MRAYVYKSLRRIDTYVYLRERDAFDCLPDPIRASLGELAFVLEFDLTAGRRLARGDAGDVHRRLVEQGFHLQLPPPDAISQSGSAESLEP